MRPEDRRLKFYELRDMLDARRQAGRANDCLAALRYAGTMLTSRNSSRAGSGDAACRPLRGRDDVSRASYRAAYSRFVT
jgi:hypothetical protein